MEKYLEILILHRQCRLTVGGHGMTSASVEIRTLEISGGGSRLSTSIVGKIDSISSKIIGIRNTHLSGRFTKAMFIV